MKLFIDNDALLKLAQYDLLDKALNLFGFAHADVSVLATARYVLLPSKDRLRRCKDEACAERLERFFSQVGKINPAGADYEMLDALSSLPNIDSGEALLLAVGASTQDSYVLTGDKRALTALSEGEALKNVRAALSGCILSFELLFAFLIEGDFAGVQSLVRAQPAVDKALSNAFGISQPASLQSVRDALDSYTRHLRDRTGALLHPPPANS